MNRTPSRDKIPPGTEVRAPNLLSAAVVGGFLLLAVALVFGRTVGHDFVNFDDNQYVYENPQLMHGLTAEGVAWTFTATRCNNWHPLTWLSYLLDYQLYGLKPWGYHLTNVLLHAATAILLFLVLWRMTGDLWPSAFVAAVFAIHPLRVESVAWVSERKDVLSGLFFMLTLAAYLGYVRRPFSPLRYLTVIAAFALGLMAKPMLVTLPFVLLLLDYWPLRRMALPLRPLSLWERVRVRAAHQKTSALDASCHTQPSPPAPLRAPTEGWSGEGSVSAPWRLLVEKLPLFVLSVASCVVTPLCQGEALQSVERFSLLSRTANALTSYVAYVGQLFYPAGLVVFYTHPESNLPAWKVAGALLLLAGITAGAVALWRRWPWLLVGWFWYLGMLVPVIGLVQVGHQSMADRYTYLPQIGLVIAVAWGVARLVGSWPQRAWACGVLAALVLAALMACAWRQTSYWHDSGTLWTRSLDFNANNVIAQNNLGVFLHDQGRDDEALPHYRRALEIAPDYADAHNNLGFVLAKRGSIAEALDHYQAALLLRPNYPEAHTNLGRVLAERGMADYAIAEYRLALEFKPDHAEAHKNLGLALVERGQIEEGIAHCRRAVAIKPDDPEAHNNLALALAAGGQTDDAMNHYRRALALKPEYAEAHNNLGRLLADLGRIDEAIAQWADLIRLKPDDVPALNQLAWALATSPETSVRDGPKAVELAQRAAKLTDGRDLDVLDTLAAAYAEAGRFTEAVQTAEQALASASSQNSTELADTLRSRIKLYQAASPYRDMTPSATPRSSHP